MITIPTTGYKPLEGKLVTEGILIAGTHAGCGKTAITAGLAAVMLKNGFRINAHKPLDFSGKGPYQDQDYLNRVTHPLHPMETMILDSPYDVGHTEWARLLHICRSHPYPCLIEIPGSVATPLGFHPDGIRDAATLSNDLEMPVLLVTNRSSYFIERMVMAYHYLYNHGIRMVGWLAVETASSQKTGAIHWEKECIYVSQICSLPYLGTLPYSPSISVEAGQQGNLIRQTEEAIDLLPLQIAASARIPQTMRADAC